MFSYRAINSWRKQKVRRKKRVFKLPPEVTHLYFYPLEEKVVEKESSQDKSELEDNKIQQAISEILDRDYKSRASDFIDISVQSNSIEEEEEDIDNIQSENPEHTHKNDSDILSLSNAGSFECYENIDQLEMIEKKKKKQKDLVDEFGKHLTNSSNQDQLEIPPKEIILNKQNSTINPDSQNYSSYESNIKNEREKENPFRRGAHYFCTFPKRKPHPVTPDMKRKIGKQREFEGKFNYYAGAYSDYEYDYEYDKDDDFKGHSQCHIHSNKEKLNDYNKYDFNGHFRKKHYSNSDENDPRYYNPYIPETTINPRVVSEKRCKKIIGKKNNKLFKTLPPKEHPEPFNYTNVFLPPKKFDKSIFYPPKMLFNLESEDSYLKHPDSPKADKIRKYNNTLFQSNIHFYDFDDQVTKKPRSNSVTSSNSSSLNNTSKNIHTHYDLKRDDYQTHLHYYDKNENPKDPLPQDLAYARRFPKNYLQSMADDK